MWKILLALCIVANAVQGDAIVGQSIRDISFEFLDKLTQKQYRSVLNLTVENASVNKINPKLKYLKNLEYLDLTNNNVQLITIPPLVHLKTLKLPKNSLKHVNMTALPPNIEVLDLSNNLLTAIPKDWRSLRNLKVLRFYKNPFDCNCYNVLNYQHVIEKGIEVTGPLLCHSPSNYVGKDVSTIECSLDDIMQYDDPMEGSGSTDIFEDILSEEKTNVGFVHETEGEEVNVDNNTIIDEKVPIDDDLIDAEKLEDKPDDIIEEEGSGDEGSGFGIHLPASGILGCVENCSTPGPVGANDEEYASPVPSPIEQFKILLDDVNIFKNPETKTTTLPPVTTTRSTLSDTTTVTPARTSNSEELVKEPRAMKGNKHQLLSNKPEDVEIIANGTGNSELERASVAPKDMTAVYAIVAVVVFLAVVFLVCFIKKNRARRNHNNRREIPLLGEEMKSINKPVVQEINEKTTKGAGIQENVPLLNGQNGKPRSDSPQLKSYVPLAHPEFLNDDEDDKQINLNGLNISPTDDADIDVEIRPKDTELLTTPERQRVTVRESEIPEPIPKTPLLVHRQKNSDGEIVSMPVP